MTRTKHYQNLSLDDIKGEEWDIIPVAEDYYFISNKGRFKSYFKSDKPKILKQFSYKNQTSVRLTLCKGKQKTFNVARLVAEIFIPNPKNYKYVFHKDLNKTWDNSADNLYWNNSDGFSLPAGNTNTKYKGVTIKIRRDGRKIFTAHLGLNGKRFYKEFLNEEEAAKYYDSLIKKFNLKRKGNFI